MANTGVYPCYENQFGIGTGGTPSVFDIIANCEEFGLSIDNNVENWNAMENEGWQSSLMTGKAITISVKAKRTIGDKGNDFVAGLAFKNGRKAEAPFQWSFPDGTKVLFNNAVISVGALGTGAATGVAPLEFEVISNGKPTITPAV